MSALLKRGAQLKRIYAASRRILRFPNFNRKLDLLITPPVLQGSACASNFVFQRNLAKVAAQYEHSEEQQSRVSDALSADEYIDHMFSKIDNDAKRFGQVWRRDVEAVFSQIKGSGRVSSIQSLYLIRCCGSLLGLDLPEERTVLVHDVWDKLQELGVPMDASHYNALLKVYLENEYNFSPPEFLASMERKGITPNRVTYQRIIEKYCLEGDLNATSAILEHMKEKDFPINETIFNSLILGHARSKDMQGAVNMLDVMRKSQIEPSAETYTALACGFAENGDLEGYRNTLSDAVGKEIYFSDSNHFHMVSSLVRGGSLEDIDEILERINIHACKSDALSAIMGLMQKGFDAGAYKIVSLLVSSGNEKAILVFIKFLASGEQALEKLLMYCQDIFKKGFSGYAYEEALRAAMKYGKTDCAFGILEEMKNVGRPIRCHYFWPILSAFRKKGDVEGTWATLKIMSDMSVPADSDTFLDFILPVVYSSNAESVISKVKELGQSDVFVTDALFFYLCNIGDFSTAADFYKEHKLQCDVSRILDVLAFRPHEDAESTVVLLKQLKEQNTNDDYRKDVLGLFLNHLLFYNSKSIHIVERFIRAYNTQGVKLPRHHVDNLCSQLRSFAPELVRLVADLEINVIRDEYMDSDFIRPSDMSVEELENRLVKVRETGGNRRPLLRHLLSHYCKKRNLDRVLEIKAELDAMDFTYSPSAYALLVNLFVAFNNLEEATKYKKEIDMLFPHFKLDAAKGLDYVTLMIKSGKAEEALEVVRNEAKDWMPSRFEDILVSSTKKLLNSAADTGNVELTQKLFQALVIDLKFSPLYHLVLEPLIRVHVVRDDYDAAIEEYRKFAVKFKIFPYRTFFFNKFIESNDPERLQKVVDISAEYGGKDSALHELAAAFISSGRVQEARKVIQTLGTNANARHLDMICHRFFMQDKMMELEQFIAITKDLYHIDRNQLYSYLLDLYIKHNDCQAALEMWNSMQEENIQPSVLTLQKLAEFLEKNGQSIPFVVPLSSDLQNQEMLFRCLNEKDEIGAVDVLRRMKKGEVHSLSPDVFIRIVDLFLEKKCLKEIVDMVQVMSCILDKSGEILRPVASKYGQAGDITSIKLLHDCMPDFVHSSMRFNLQFFNAYITSGQPELLLDELEKSVTTTKQLFSLTGFLNLLQTYPETLDRATKLTDLLMEKDNFDSGKTVLWLYYFLQEKYEEAEHLYKEHRTAIMKSDFPFVKIIQTVRRNKNERLGRNLVDMANRTLKISYKARAYNCLLDTLVHYGKLDEAVALIEEANSQGVTIEKFLHPTLVSLQKSLTEKNMPVTFVIPFEGEDASTTTDDSD